MTANSLTEEEHTLRNGGDGEDLEAKTQMENFLLSHLKQCSCFQFVIREICQSLALLNLEREAMSAIRGLYTS
jgi:hypothetical protein